MNGSCVGSQESVWAVILTFDVITCDGICFYFNLCGDVYDCIVFMWQGLLAWTFRASVRRDQELPPCCTELFPADSKTDPPLAKAEPVGDAGGTSAIAYLRKGEKAVQQQL